MNKLSFSLVLIIALVFASNFKQHFVQFQQAEDKVQLLTQSNQAQLDALNAKQALTEHEQWLQQHLSNSLRKSDATRQGAQLTFYSLLSMFLIMLLCALAFVAAGRRNRHSQIADVSCAPPKDNRVAQLLSWQALGSMASNFNGQTLRQNGTYQLRITHSAQWIIFTAGFALLGSNALGFAFYKAYITASDWSFGIGIPFIAVGIGLLVYGFLKGWIIDTAKGLATCPLHEPCDITEVVALQFITGIAGGSRKIFNTYEINMVLKDAKRITLIRHGSYQGAIHSAALLSEFLKVPVWRKI